MTLHDTRLIAEAARIPQRIFWRKQILHRRIALEIQWRQAFPRHSFANLRLIDSPSWSEEIEAAWCASARAYHKDRKRSVRR